MAALGAGNASAAAPPVVGPRMPLHSVCSSFCSSSRSSSVALASLAFTFPPPPSRFLLHPQRLQEHHHGITCSFSSGPLPKLPARVQHTSRRSFFVMAPAQSSSGLPSLPKAVLTAKVGLTKPAVNNIAAEGRLTLADALVYACNLKVGKIVHLATLNGARIVALRNEIGENVHFGGGIRFGTLSVKATSSSYEGAGNLSGGDDRHTAMSPVGDTEEATEPTPESSKHQGSLKAVGILVAVLGIGCLAALALTLSSGGPAGLLSTVSKSGFPAAFALIFVSEIGDKTFFIAALLAMRHSKWLVLLGASGALGVMTVISVVIGKLFQRVPAQLQTTLPVGEYAAVALLVWFGLRSIKSAWDIPSAPSGAESQPAEIGELAEAEEFLKQADKKVTTPLEILVEAFTLIFVAEWGDRSMLATIALGAAQSPWGVASGAIAGHVLATLLAVVGGALLARYLSEKLIGYFGGFLFLGFAGATLAGVF